MDTSVYFLTICLPLVTVLLIFGMRYFSAVQQAKLRFAQDEAYRQIAEKATAAQAETAAALVAMNEALADMKARLAGVEKVLKDVE
ncbi:MAG: hypothetical protein JO142_05940 [Burkholderiales bacterium]|nr:hypothetical protein [Burkholderiales bacterium]